EGKEAGVSATRRNISDMGNDYYFPNAALKLQLSDKFSFGLLYDQPFGADAEYSGQNVFVSDPSNTILAPAALDSIRTNTINTTFNNLTADQRVGALLKAQGVDLTSQVGQQQYIATLNAYNNDPTKKAVIDAAVKQGVATQVDAGIKQINGLLGTGNTKVKVDTQNLSFVFGFQPNQNWNIYAGGVYQTVKGNVSLRGQAYSIYNGYDADIKETGGAGWLAGVAYQIPEIALKASLTYRSEIDHDVNIREKIPTLSALSLLGQDAAAAAIANSSADTTITTPQSVNFDFQTGIM
ncbi:MAG TPA: long-chain fatty acid transporter, partial [Acinetobacter nosocomialis]|nr:long-chain fatty acid transporter [Acinetobacter nosocomialis]